MPNVNVRQLRAEQLANFSLYKSNSGLSEPRKFGRGNRAASNHSKADSMHNIVPATKVEEPGSGGMLTRNASQRFE